MSTDQFLTDEQAVVFGRFVSEPSQAELEQFFYLDAADLEGIAERSIRPRYYQDPVTCS